MKKYVALILAAITVAACFTACGKKPDSVTAEDSKAHAVMTDENNELIRDEAGNIIYYVTDTDGYMVKDENGEYETRRVAVKDALVTGKKINCKTYNLTIPDGWVNSMSYTDLIIEREGTKDKIKIMLREGQKLETIMAQNSSVINLAKSNFPGAVGETKEIKINKDITAQYTYAFVADTGVRNEEADGSLSVVSSFVGYIYIQHRDDVYACFLTSDRNMNEQIDEITKILGTIEFLQ